MGRFGRTWVRQVAAPPETVFDVLTDHRGYSAITPVRRSELEREGSPEPGGLGAIRVLGIAGPPIREEVIAFERPTRFGYEALSGLPVREHIGTVTLERQGERGTLMTYRIQTVPSVPLLGFAVFTVIRTVVGRLIAAVAREAERRARAEA